MTRSQGKRKGKEEVKEKKKRTKGVKKPQPTEESGDDNSDTEKRSQSEDGDAFKINWKEDGLSEKLLASITDDPKIKQGLFPSPGANVSSSKGGGQKKTTWQWQLAELVFSDHPKYSSSITSIKRATTPKLQGIWSDRIRNRLKKMAAITRAYMNEMGQTGAGISREEDINMEMKNKFTNKWEEIKEECPWFFTMRDLIAERPNIIPTGIGNSSSPMDPSVLSSSVVEAEEMPRDLGILNDNLAGEIMEDDEGIYATTGDEGMSEPLTAPVEDEATWQDSETPERTTGGSHKRKPVETSSRPGASNSKQRGPGPASKKTKIEEFAGIAASEEQTRQREIDLARAKVLASAQVQVETQKAKVESTKAKVELERMKLEMKKDYKMEKMRLKHAREMASPFLISREAMKTMAKAEGLNAWWTFGRQL